jgi:hypothetical protein
VFVRVLVTQTKLPVSVKSLEVIETTASLRVKAKTAPLALLLMFKNEFASFAQVSTGGVVSGIVAVVDADVVDMVPAIPFWPKKANVPALVSVTDAVVPDATLLFTVIVQTVFEV